MQTSHDIIIVGGGMVGSTLACALAQQTSLSILVLEAQVRTMPFVVSPHYHHRVSAITLASQRIFQALKLWDDIKSLRISPFKQILVRDVTGKGKIQFDCSEIAEPVLGYIIENNIIQAVLDKRIQQYPHIEFISPIQLTTFREQGEYVELNTADGRSFTARLAIGVDGANSWLRKQADIDSHSHSYQQHAIVTTVQHAFPHERIAQQIFLTTGPLAFLPLADAHTSSIVWSLSVDAAEHMYALDDNQFKIELAQAFKHQLGEIIDTQQRFKFPLYKQHTKSYLKSRVVLAGDAAHTIHPMAGQGVNMGLLDITSLTEVIADACRRGRDFSQTAILRRYERWRKTDNMAMFNGVDLLKKIFATEQQSWQRLLAFGLNATDNLRVLKNVFTRHAVGKRSGLPRMAQGYNV